MKLLVDAGEFMDMVCADVQAAHESVLVQAMTFEGDLAGRAFANLLIRSTCADRRLIVDCYSRYFHSCRFRMAPACTLDADLRNEVHATSSTDLALRRAGVRVRWANPAGLLLRRLPARNHKKSIVIDRRIAYLGGLNFSDHNFAWHDLMLRLDDPRVATFLADDIEAAWRGTAPARWDRFDGVAIGTMNGRRNEQAFTPIFDCIAAAREEIVVESPYLSFPFTDRLHDAARRGVRVIVLAPSPHPYPAFGRYLAWECARSGFELRALPGMTHVKAMLIDSRRLILGSSNFDYLSWRLLHEIVAIIDERAVVADFIERVAQPDLARSRVVHEPARPFGGLRRLWMRAVGGAAVAIAAG